MRNGIVVKGLGGRYEVLVTSDEGRGERIACLARGNLRRDEEKVLIGDRVALGEVPGGELVIENVLPRKNALIRPPMANLDCLYAVIASARPMPSLETLDKLLAISEHHGIRAAVIITKTDCDEQASAEYAEIYRLAGYPVFSVSSVTGEGIEALRQDLSEQMRKGCSAAFAGASGVGKSTLLNALFPNLMLATGEISRKIARGKHTTRHVELFETEDGGFLADTPGFSLLDFAHFDFFALEDLFDCFRDFAPCRGRCRYADCTHTGEGAEECAVAAAVAEGRISKSRHESYRAIWQTLKSKRRY
jgi:ribosome biogenesis GTPase